MKFKPTADQIAIIKACASRESGPHVPASVILLEPGIRHNTEDTSKPNSMNIALVTNESDSFNDTDLSEYGDWSDFRKGIELDPNGRGIFDFYIRHRYDRERELCGNITVYVSRGKMSFIEGYDSRYADPLWKIEGGFRADVKAA